MNLWLIFQPICEAYSHRTVCKARLVHSAHKCYTWAIGLLLVPVVTVVCVLWYGMANGMIKPPERKAEAGVVAKLTA